MNAGKYIVTFPKKCITYRVTIQVVPNLPLTSKQKFRLNLRPMY